MYLVEGGVAHFKKGKMLMFYFNIKLAQLCRICSVVIFSFFVHVIFDLSTKQQAKTKLILNKETIIILY